MSSHSTPSLLGPGSISCDLDYQPNAASLLDAASNSDDVEFDDFIKPKKESSKMTKQLMGLDSTIPKL
ncbi:unnamed protein product [Dibothriocephalus latus]|uniref:Uncharacterized protein n=1 Tax=Dibothriocephalus latus TaxID=60516 RepID=A0A3P7PCP0_DIBLA|nr:unnamed protein product [Dibothriocephalus latus]